MQIEFANRKLEKLMTDMGLLKKKAGIEIAKSVYKRLNQIEAANNLYVLLQTRSGNPEPLNGDMRGTYSITLTANFRLIFKPKDNMEEVEDCNKVVIMGVNDYHGSKNNWVIP